MSPRDKTINAALAAHARGAKAAPLRMFVPSKKRRKGDRLVLKEEMLARIRLSYQKVWRMMCDGTLPRSVSVGSKVAWYESEIDQWLDGLERTTLKGDTAASGS